MNRPQLLKKLKELKNKKSKEQFELLESPMFSEFDVSDRNYLGNLEGEETAYKHIIKLLEG